MPTSEGLPDVGYYYTTRDRVPALMADGIPAGEPIHTEALTGPEAQARHGLPEGVEIVRITVNLKALRDSGHAMPAIVP